MTDSLIIELKRARSEGMRDDDGWIPQGFWGDDAGRGSLGRLIPPPLNRNVRFVRIVKIQMCEAFRDNSRNGLE